VLTQATLRLGLTPFLAWLLVITLLATACGPGPSSDPSQASHSPATTQETLTSPREEQIKTSSEQRVRFERISIEQGLSQSTITCILQDSQGFIWFGTEDGLNRYDAYNFTVYQHDPEDPNSLSNDYITAIHEDPSGLLWIGTRGGGLNRYQPETGQWRHYLYDGSDPDSYYRNWITAIVEDQEGLLWIGTYGDGLYQFDRETEQFIQVEDIPCPCWINTLYEDRSGELWIGTESGGLLRFDRSRTRLSSYKHDPNHPFSLSADRITSIYEDRSGSLWVGTLLGGLNRFDRETERFIRYQSDPNDPYSLSYHIVVSIHEDRQGRLWIGTGGGGLNQLDRASGRFVRYLNDPKDSSSLSSNIVMNLYEDQTGNLWIGTMGAGVNRVDRSADSFRHYQADPRDPNSLSNNSVRSIWEDRAGVLWVGTDDGLNRFDPGTGQWRQYREDPLNPYSLSRSAVRVVYEDRSGDLWVGVFEGGLNRFNSQTERFTHFLGSDHVVAIVEDQAGSLWIGTEGNGLYEFDPKMGTWHQYTQRDSLSSDLVREIYQDRSGTFWVGTDSGLDRFDPNIGQWRHYYHDPDRPHSLSQGWVVSIYQDQVGTLWIGTVGGGLDRFEPESESFTHYTQRDGLANDEVYGILEDRQGHLWISTNNGLSRFDPQIETFKNYGAESGLKINKFIDGAFHQSPRGEMFFGGVNGLVVFYPDRIHHNPYRPPIVLTSLTQDGEEFEVGRAIESIQEMTLRWPENGFEFEFAALNYTQPDKNQYAYMLEGFDEDWIDLGTRRSGKYTNLPGGTYTLRLKGSNNDGVWNEEGVSIQLIVVPPFWATWWFRAMIALGLVGGVLASYQLRVRSIQARSRQLERHVKKRTSQLEALYRAEEKMHRHLHLDQVLQALVDVAVDILQADKSAVWVWDEKQQRWVLRVARGFSGEGISQLSFTSEEASGGGAPTSGETVVVKNALTTPHVEDEPDKAVHVALEEAIRSHMKIPIQVDGQTFGVFDVSFTQPHAFERDEQRLFLALAQRASQAIENARLYEQAQELAALEERQRLARDLHDAVTQTLFSASLIAEVLPRIWEQSPDDGRRRLEQVRQGTRSALAEMRTLLLELRPTGLAETDLGELLHQLGEAISGRTSVSVNVSVQGGEEESALPTDVHIALYRIAQEALNNVAKHARASQATVDLKFAPPQIGGTRAGIRLSISDDGCGFDPHHVPPGHFGINIMRERAEAVGGHLEIKSRPGHGTRVMVEWTADE
jgi:signal transduction histidine kinase/ligand-binding sensor domain-containing protein